jgi:DNA helicase HerA-like ATPase
MKKLIGHIVSGSLGDGFTLRIAPDVVLADIKTGKFVSIVTEQYTFFSLITDLALAVSHPDILQFPPEPQEILLRQLLARKDMYATAIVRPMLMKDREGALSPVKTVPHHFAEVFEASNQDIAHIFGHEEDVSGKFFTLGTPLDMTTDICINVEKITERSSGIFGKTGTGKTFLTRLLLAGLIKHDKASVLIFDMHNEYGLQARQESHHAFVKGLKTLFPDRIAIFSLDPASTRRRGGNPDVDIIIPYNAIQVEDILSLQDELNLHATGLEAAHLIAAQYKNEWLSALLGCTDIKEFAHSIGAHSESVAALYRKLKRIETLPFFVPHAKTAYSVIDQMMEYIARGMSIIIEFGNFTTTFIYLLIANIITRRIHALYIAKTEQFLGSQRIQDEPKKLLICIEEAHKFLNPQAAKQTIFGTIAREMRKYYVSLLIVDQRPSGIDQEVLSQIGTKIIAQLTDEKDINAVLSGVNHANNLRNILASLDTKKQVLVIGHAIAMPVVIHTRTYDEKFYRAVSPTPSAQEIQEKIQELF